MGLSVHENRTQESVAQIMSMSGAAIAFLTGLIVFNSSGTSLSGQVSVATVTSILVAVLGSAAFAVSYVRVASRTIRWRQWRLIWRIRDVASLTIAASAMAAMGALAVFTVFQRMFQGLRLGQLAATLMAAATVAAACYLLANIAQAMNTSGVAALLGAFLAAGVVASTLTADDPGWWQKNFSALGMSSEASSSAFNFTVITAGVVLSTLADYLVVDLRRWRGVTKRAVQIIRVLLIVIGLGLIGLGFIPVDLSRLIHDINAVTVLVGFGGLILSTPYLLSGLPRPFLLSTAVLGAVIIFVVALWMPLRVYNFTAVELLSVLIIFAWLSLFTRTVGSGPQTMREPEPVRTVAELEPVQVPPLIAPVALRPEAKAVRRPSPIVLAAGLGIAAGAVIATLISGKS